jgi:activator of 2-hydroxyglutaryl-CoA dehydratase
MKGLYKKQALANCCQYSKGIEVDCEINVVNVAMNEKCGDGTGRFLEVKATFVEGKSVQKMGPIAVESDEPYRLRTTCTIFAEYAK